MLMEKVIVTGGTRGIGLSVVKRFLTKSSDNASACQVYFVGRNPEIGLKVQTELRKEFPKVIPPQFYAMDVGDCDQVEQFYSNVMKDGQLNHLVNAAGKTLSY